MIRLAQKDDMQEILRIYSIAKNFMHKNGNPNQWNGSYPDEETLLEDIKNNQLFVMYEEKDNHIYGCFALIDGNDPTYEYIDGKWKSDTAYGTIHRIASDRTRKGIFDECTRFAQIKYDHLRVDTHEDNEPMQHVALKNGFEYTGIIYLKDNSPRKAYEWLKNQN